MSKVVSVVSHEDHIFVFLEDGTVLRGKGHDEWVESTPIPLSARHREKDPDAWKAASAARNDERQKSGFSVVTVS